MARIKTNNTGSNNKRDKLADLLAEYIQLQKKAQAKQAKDSANNAKRKEADKRALDLANTIDSYDKKRKELDEKLKEDKYKDRLNLAKDSVNAVMPADRRQFFGASAIGAIAGIDPAIVKMLGIDKLGANLWNSKFGFSAIQKRHDQKVKEEKLNEEFGINSGKDKEKYGSVVKDDPIKELKGINKNTKDIAQNTSSDKGGTVAKDNGEKGGLLSKILGFGKKLLIPLLVGMLVNAFRNHVKNGIANLLGGSDTAKMLGGAVADFLPGAIGGWAAAKKFGVPWWKGVLIGGTITYVWPRLMRTFGDIGRMFSSEGNPDAGSTNRYLEKALGGALVGASLAKWGPGSGKAAAIGAAVGFGIELILDQVQSFKRIFSGESTDEDTGIAGLGKDVLKGAIFGASLGIKGGIRGILIGALLGAAGGTFLHAVKSITSGVRDLVSGEGKEMTGKDYAKNIMSDAIAGASLGFFGGPIGILIGAVLGAAWGAIRTLISDVNASANKKQEAGKTTAAEITNKVDSKDATNSTDFAYNRQKELEAKKAAGTLTDEEKKELGKIESATYKANKRLADVNAADTNKDGFISPEELKAFDEEHGGGVGGTARSVRQMRELMEQSGGKGFNLKDASNYQLEKEGITAPLQSTPMPTTTQIKDEKNTKAVEDGTKATITLTEAINNLAKKPDLGKTEIIENNATNEPLTAYPTTGITAAGLIK